MRQRVALLLAVAGLAAAAHTTPSCRALARPHIATVTPKAPPRAAVTLVSLPRPKLRFQGLVVGMFMGLAFPQAARVCTGLILIMWAAIIAFRVLALIASLPAVRRWGQAFADAAAAQRAAAQRRAREPSRRPQPTWARSPSRQVAAPPSFPRRAPTPTPFPPPVVTPKSTTPLPPLPLPPPLPPPPSLSDDDDGYRLAYRQMLRRSAPGYLKDDVAPASTTPLPPVPPGPGAAAPMDLPAPSIDDSDDGRFESHGQRLAYKQMLQRSIAWTPSRPGTAGPVPPLPGPLQMTRLPGGGL